jgi:hypothetical protein
MNKCKLYIRTVLRGSIGFRVQQSWVGILGLPLVSHLLIGLFNLFRLSIPEQKNLPPKAIVSIKQQTKGLIYSSKSGSVPGLEGSWSGLGQIRSVWERESCHKMKLKENLTCVNVLGDLDIWGNVYITLLISV